MRVRVHREENDLFQEINPGFTHSHNPVQIISHCRREKEAGPMIGKDGKRVHLFVLFDIITCDRLCAFCCHSKSALDLWKSPRFILHMQSG